MSDGEIEAVIEAPAEDVVLFREVLAQVLAYGRADAVPTRVVVRADRRIGPGGGRTV
ncbi:hypothetical protein [Streptomyces sp. MUM 203J]|uniref:hypothetical protein n=1 Tax=Streptomyces sp. MUM 203J TaxID=2791990 RepID=UPI001F0480AF|nr:hypothetical protein [Streptomyces sp. MUM 203J]